VSEFLEDELEKVALEVNDLQEQHDKLLADNKQREASGVVITQVRRSEGEDLLRRLTEARQRQTPLLLLSILQSSDRLESATRTLQQSSESQVKFAESQVRVLESLAQIMKKLLKSSHLLEQLTVYLMVLTGLNIFIIEYGQGLFKDFYGIIGAVGLVAAILAMAALGGYLPRLRKLDKSEP
jgi:vacuolar-type H+-ATPase subunit I/STV1